MPSLSSKFDKGEAKGIVVIGVTNESLELVDAWVKKMQPTYPIVVVKGNAFDNALGVKFFPTHGVITPDGILSYAGSSPESAFSAAAKEATKGSIYPKSLAKIRKTIKAGELSKAYADLISMQSKGKVAEKDTRWFGDFRGWIEEMAASEVKLANAQFKAGRVLSALNLAEPVAQAKTAFPASTDASALLGKMAALANYKKELKGGKLFAAAELLAKEDEYTEAAKKFVSIGKKYEGTLIGAAASKEARKLVDSGKPGYKSVCQACRKEKRACDKHMEKVKL